MVEPSIFRAYDIRGVTGETLTEATVHSIGRALGSLALECGDRAIVLGRDGRLSGPSLSHALTEGILATGCDVIDIGLVPTPVLYYATFILETRSGIMLTGSHNPPDHNGLKIMIAGKPLAEEGLTALYERIRTERFLEGAGDRCETDVLSRYLRHVHQDTPLARPLRIVVDCGSGVASVAAPDLFRAMGCEVTELFCEVDGHFPHHHPDPSQPENLQDLIAAVQQEKADVGLAFDGDGDRLGVVTDEGTIIWPDRQLMLFAKSVLADHPHATILYDVKCTRHLDSVIRAHGGNPLMWKTGHSLIKAKLAETGALLAGEMSGHLFFRDRWYGFDDAIYAAARLLQILSRTSEKASTLFRAIPDSINTPELKIPVPDHEKFSLVSKLSGLASFCNDNVSTIDGLRLDFPDGWGLVRPSNTTPCLVLRFEADSPSVLEKIQAIFREGLLAIKPDLVLPF